MKEPLSFPRVAVPDVSPDTLTRAICPSCHTPHAFLMLETLKADDGWQCVTCGTRWNARRLETVAAYAAWAADHDRA